MDNKLYEKLDKEMSEMIKALERAIEKREENKKKLQTQIRKGNVIRRPRVTT